MGRAMGLDVGTKTIGLAVSDPLNLFASPLFTLAREGVRRDAAVIAAEGAKLGVDRWIVGLPYELDGSEQRSARLARQVGDALSQLSGLPVIYIDERYSSVEANRHLLRADLSREKRKAVIDQAAAVIILQSYLDHGDWTQAKEPASR